MKLLSYITIFLLIFGCGGPEDEVIPCIPQDEELIGNWMQFKNTNIKVDTTYSWDIDSTWHKLITTFNCDSERVWNEFYFNVGHLGVSDTTWVETHYSTYNIRGDTLINSIYNEWRDSIIVTKYTYYFEDDTLYTRTMPTVDSEGNTYTTIFHRIRVSDARLEQLFDLIP